MYFLCRLIPPRPSFAKDMTPSEASAMHEHVAYWTDLLGKGKAIAFGPVMDPKGPWGVGIVSVSDQEELGKLRSIRRVIHWELAGVVVILLCAALMARGVGYLGG